MNDYSVRLPSIPEYITVHLGRPTSDAPNVTVPFYDYIKNVASSEIYPTWNENAIRANVLAQISFALNRIYTEYYRSRGYDFDITNSTSIDQSYVNGRDIFNNVSRIVDDLSGTYISRQGDAEPLFAAYCDGVEVQCSGLSQWGSESLAASGLTPYEILRRYYGSDIEIVTDVPITGAAESYPGVPLRRGSSGNDVYFLQRRLNRIARNYPAIPQIDPALGFFGEQTDEAVRAFQRIFSLTEDGIVGRATWYRIAQIYSAVRSLSSVTSEGVPIEDVTEYFPTVLERGSVGVGVREVQALLSFVAQFNQYIPRISVDSIFGVQTENAVNAFQTYYGLELTGKVDTATWEKLRQVYITYRSSLPDAEGVYPGTAIVRGDRGDEVLFIQRRLNYISDYYPSIPKLTEDGIYGRETERAVREFQRLFGLDETGFVGEGTYSALAREYDRLREEREGS